MKCDDARLMMSEFLDGRLREAEVRNLNHHLLLCTACRPRWQAMQQVSALFQAADVALPPPDFTARVMKGVRHIEAERRAGFVRGQSPLYAWGAMGAAVVLLGAVLVISVLSSVQNADAGPSVSFLSLSMAISSAAIRAATLIEGSLTALSRVAGPVPFSLLVLALAWMVAGTLALAFTVGSLIGSYRPLSAAASGTSET